MIKCLLDGDYARAERAFKLLLSTEILGRLPDLRVRNLWGIGAEILLNRKGRVGQIDEGRLTFFNREAVEDVKNYYRSLIIQYTSARQNP